MYIQLQVKTEVVCIEEEENRDKYGIRFCKCFLKIFFIKFKYLLLHGRHVPRDL